MSACSQSPPVPAKGAEPRVGGRAVVAFATGVPAPRNITPVLASDSAASDLTRLQYESLIGVDPSTGAPSARLAERFAASPDGRALTFTLRPGLVWSDGSELRADEFKLTVELLLRSQLNVRKATYQDVVGASDFVAGRAPSVAGIEIDDRTITVRLGRAFCPALTAIGTLAILPRQVFGKYLDPADPARNADAAPENSEPPLASGAFAFKERRADGIVLRRNDRFFLGRPLLDELVLGTVPNSAAWLAGLRAGDIHVAAAAVLAPSDKEDLRRSRDLELRQYLQPRYTYIGWNLLRGDAEFFQSKAVRQALAYGLDVEAILDKILGGDAVRMLAHTPPGSWAYDPAGLSPYRYNPARAEQLLDDEGWRRGADGVRRKDGRPLQFTLTTSDQVDFRALLDQAAQQYRQLGILVTPQVIPFDQLVAVLGAANDPTYGSRGGRAVDAWIIRWVLPPDPDSYSVWHSSQIRAGLNYGGYSDAVVDKALEDGRTSCAPEQRKAAYHAVDVKLNDDQPYLFAFAPKAYVIQSRRLKGVEPSTFGGYLWNTEKWWLGD